MRKDTTRALLVALCTGAALTACAPSEPEPTASETGAASSATDAEIAEPPTERLGAGLATFVIGEDRYDMPVICEHYDATDVSEEQIVFTAHTEEGVQTGTGWSVGASGAWYADRASIGALIWVDDVAASPDFTWHLGGGDEIGETVHAMTDLEGYMFVSGWFEARVDGVDVAAGDRLPGWFEAHC